MKQTITLLSIVAGALLLASTGFSADSRLVLIKELDDLGFLKPIPVSISGFTGEVDGVLKNDLLFMGIQNVSLDQAKFLITGSNAGRVEGRVTEKINQQSILAKAYTGGSLRTQAHALADDIALALTGKPGIAQSKITFKGEIGRGNGEIYIADYDGHNAQSVTHDQTIAAAPCWSGHAMLYYVSYKLGAPKIFSHHLSSGARKLITPFPGSNISPAVSPDGNRLAMILSKGGSPDLYVSDREGGGLKQLTFTREAESSPCWSPDGQSICYVSRERGPASLFVISASGGSARRISTNFAPNPTEPDWSPDGKWIAFTSLTGGFQTCIVPAHGGDAIVVAPGEDPSWAPNSRALIFSHGPDHSKKLSLLDVPTKQVKDIARIAESNSQSQPSWAK